MTTSYQSHSFPLKGFGKGGKDGSLNRVKMGLEPIRLLRMIQQKTKDFPPGLVLRAIELNMSIQEFSFSLSFLLSDVE